MRTVALALLLVVALVGISPLQALAQDGGTPPARPADPPTLPPTTSGFDAGPLKNLKFSGVLQVWYQGGDEGFIDTFRVRRLRLYLSGDVASRAKFMVMVDPSKALAINQEFTTLGGTPVVTAASVNQASRMLLDAYISIGLARHLEVVAGQFKLPMNLEGSAPVHELPVVERSLMTSDRARGGAFGDIRDVGVMARGTFDNGLEYRVGIFNSLGASPNDTDRDQRKALAGRLAYATPIPGLQVGGYVAWDRAVASGPAMPLDRTRRRAGVDLRYQIGAVRLQGELVGGRDGALARRGYYANLSWRLLPKAEVSARLDVFDPDTRVDASRADVLERDYIGAASYLISGHNLKLQAEYLRKTFARSISPAANVFLSNLQVAW